MEIRAVDGQAITVPAADGAVVYMCVQNRHSHRTAAGGAAVFEPHAPRLRFGNRQELEGEVWIGRRVSRLVIERSRHGG